MGAGDGKTQMERVYEAVRTDILSFHLSPGTRLVIHELCDRLGVSNGAVREALSRLASEGLVLIEPQKGFSVAKISKTELIDLTEARIHIERLCLRLSIENKSLDWESSIIAAHYRLGKVPERDEADGDRLNPAWASAHATFHHALVANCPVKTLLTVRDQLFQRSERYRHLSLPLRHGDRKVAEEHTGLMEAALNNDIALIEHLIGEHLNLTTTILLQASELA